MRRVLVGVSAIAVWAVFGGLGGCSVGTDCDFGLCAGEPADDSGQSSIDGGADVTVNPCSERPTDPACLDESTAVFVASSGSDDAPGTMAAPKKTLPAALTTGKPRVYVCDGVHTAPVEIKAPVAIFGGVSCAWAPAATKAKIAPAKGIALRVTKVSGPVLVQDVEIVGSADPDAPGDSAIAVFVAESSSVTLRNVVAAAGNATSGAKGLARSNYTETAKAGGFTNTAASGNGPHCTCTDGTSSTGGNGATGAGGGISAGTAVPSVGGVNAGQTGLSCNPGTVGANGLGKGAGAPSTGPGQLSNTGWQSTTPDLNAPNGNPAQGGGGGGARTDLTLGGGGGGCGGCGGAGGGVGGSGGSSFAVLSFSSIVTLEGAALRSGAAGNAGDGGNGQDGQAGGAAGAGVCNGGPGGAGAGGSGGGGGAGGHSVPIAFIGDEPTTIGGTRVPGSKGIGGAGGAPGAGPGNGGTTGTKGTDGKSQEKLAL